MNVVRLFLFVRCNKKREREEEVSPLSVRRSRREKVKALQKRDK
jgi:hypothetical protein